MGAKLCCLNPSSPNQDHTEDPRDRVVSKCAETVTDEDHTIVFPKEAISSEKVEILTLNDILLASPGRNSHSSPCIITGNDCDVIQQSPNKIFFSPDFFTPRNSFSSGNMWTIDEGEENELSAPAVSRKPKWDSKDGEV
ncbi:Vacuolar protein sorting/targeting protein like [Actinidia chinensis var. chinensis]|uniref:Vacuolar protein sorting/targeting protein like n=1 Tax=Actinidia chinensis var. chinensis TaxID=1590841 RepID=A0A2R6Q9V3_ACTCC|nr:Vacuolar protein sorting/targeting protein like [Actinidia chinensis var. chinensis]